MNIRRAYIRTLLLGFVAIFAIVVLPAPGFAEPGTTDVNTGGEPGAGCEAAGVGFSCSADQGAPLVGNAFITWDSSTQRALLSGTVEQNGARNCAIDVENQPLNPEDIPNIDAFDALTAKNLLGTCLQNVVIIGDNCTATDTEIAEVTQAKKMVRGPNIIIVEVSVRPIRCQQ